MLRVPTDSILVGKTLAETRIGSSTGLIILSLFRSGRSETLPNRQTVLRGGDGLLVQGRVDQFRELRRWSDLVIEREAPVLKSMVASKVAYAAVTIADSSPVVSELVRHAAFRTRFDVAVVGIMRDGSYRLTNLAYVPIKSGDQVLVQGEVDAIAQLENFSDFTSVDVYSRKGYPRTTTPMSACLSCVCQNTVAWSRRLLARAASLMYFDFPYPRRLPRWRTQGHAPW